MKKILSRAAAVLSAVVMAVTTLSPGFSAAAESIVYHWDNSAGVSNPYLKTAKYAKDGGVPGTHLPAYDQLTRFKVAETGEYAFCIEPGTHIGGYYNDDGELEYAGYDIVETNDYMTGLGKDFQAYLGRVQYYGFASHKNSGDYCAATQMLTWEMLMGLRGHKDKDFSKCSDVLYNDYVYPKNSWCTEAGTKKAYNEIVNNVINHANVPSGSNMYRSKKLSQADPALIKYNTSNMRYEATIKVPAEYTADNGQLAHNFSGLKSKLEKLTRDNFKGTYGRDYGVDTKQEGSNIVYTIWSKTRQFTQGVKTTEAIKMKLKSGISDQQRLFVSPGKQTCLISTIVDPVEAYVSIASYNEPNFEIEKTYTDVNNKPITGVSLTSYLSQTQFVASTVINNKTYYVKADPKPGGEAYEFNFNSYVDNIASATKFTPIKADDKNAGVINVYDLPTDQTGGRKYTVKEYSVPDGFDQQSQSVTLPSPSSSDYETNPANPTLGFNNTKNSNEYSNVTLRKDIVDVTTEFTKMDEAEQTERIADAMAETSFIVGYSDGNTVRYFTNAYLEPGKALPSGPDTSTILSDMGLTMGNPYLNYNEGSGQYYLPFKKEGNKLVFNESYTTTDAKSAYRFKPCADYSDKNFSKIFLNFVMENKRLVFVEVEHGKGFSYDINDIDETKVKTSAQFGQFLNGFSHAGMSTMSLSGLVSGLGLSSGVNPYVVATSEGNNSYATLTNKSAYFDLSINKEDKNGDPIEGAVFELYRGHLTLDQIREQREQDGGGTDFLESAASDENGVVKFNSVLGYYDGSASYTYIEKSAPKGYVIKDVPYYYQTGSATGSTTTTFSNVYEGSKKGTTIINDTHVLNLNIHKTDPVNDVPVPGIVFDVKNNSGKVVATLTTDKDGSASVSGLPLGKLDESTDKFEISYTLTERPDSDYVMVDAEGNVIDTVSVDVTGSDITDNTVVGIEYTSTINNYMQTVDLKVHKIDDKGEPISGVKFDVKPVSDIIVKGNTIQKAGQVVGTITTDETGYAYSTYTKYQEGSQQGQTVKLPIYAGYEYALEETFAPEPYVKAGTVTFKAEKNNSTLEIPHEVTVINKPQKGTINVYKVDTNDNKKFLQGAVFALTCADDITVNDAQYPAGTTIATLITDENGYTAVSDLPVSHEYILTEVKAPDGYKAKGNTTVNLAYDPSVEYVSISETIDNSPTEAYFTKKSITGGDEIPGAKLQVIDENGNIIDQWISTTEPHKIVGKLSIGKTYTLHEEIAPDGFVIASDIQFTINENGTANVEMTDDTTKVQISKKDITNDEELPGATLQVIDKNGNVVEQWVSSSEPHMIEAKLIAGETYTLHETIAPNGYVVANDVQFTVSEDGSVDAVNMTDDTTKVQISKKDITNDKELPGATLQVIDKNGSVVEEWVSSSEPHMIEAKLIAGETYTLHETIAPDGYVVANDIQFTVSEDGSVNVVKMTDDTTKVQISKKDITNDKELPGATLQVIDKNGNVVEQWVSSSEPHMIEAKLIAGETYTLHETIAPDGYVVANDIQFTVSEDGSVDVVKMTDDTTKVQISKKDITNDKELPGATLQVIDKNGNVVEQWVSSSEPHMIEAKLIAGETYTLHETIAPDGYVVANDIQFTVSEDGSVDAVKMTDDTTKVQISKKDITNDKELPGATLQVIDKNGNVVEQWVSSSEPHMIEAKLIAGETYTLHETIAPDGYVVANDIQFTVSEDGSVDAVVMKDKRSTVIINKEYKFMIAPAEEGAQFTLSSDVDVNWDNVSFENIIVVSKNSRKLVFKSPAPKADSIYSMVIQGLPNGSYTVTEDLSPDGFIKDTNTYSFRLEEGYFVFDGTRYDNGKGSVDLVNMYSEFSVSKVNDKGIALCGAVLALYDENGNEIERWTSDGKDKVFKGLPYGNYIVKEIHTPDGYNTGRDIAISHSENKNGDNYVFVNHKGTIMPETGGEGVIPIMFSGILLATAGLFLTINHKKQERI